MGSMDSRTALLPDSRLSLGPEYSYTIRREAGRGSSCIVYDGSYTTNAGDLKTVRIRECYPYDLPLSRMPNGNLFCPQEASNQFEAAKEQMYTDFRRCNSLFYADPISDSIINTLNIYRANNTVYTVALYARENTLSAINLPTLEDCVSVVRQTARAVSCIHEAGFLYLDTKPENISVIMGAAPRIQLFDFDSLLPLSRIRDGSVSGIRLSYTRGFAAMELRRGITGLLGFHTDVYGIGALLFFLLFGRIPEAPDCSSRAVYDYRVMRYDITGFPDRLRALLDRFFHRTLAGYYPDRCSQMTEVISYLDEIGKVADPSAVFLVSAAFSTPSCFIGRSKEIDELEKLYRDPSQNLLIVSGMGGIGKSTLVRKFLSSKREEWDSIIFLYYRRSLRETFLDDRSMRIHNTERLPEESENDYYERKMSKFRGIVRRERVLLVIDDFPDPQSDELSELSGFGCRTILITRRSVGTLNLPVLHLEAIQAPSDLRDLFAHYLGREILPSETDTAEAIIRSLSGHTLAVELFARQISSSFLSLQEAFELLEKQGVMHAISEKVDYLRDEALSYETIDRIISRLFETDRISAEQKTVLKLTALFPAPGIRAKELMRLSGTENAEVFHTLIRSGWITQESVKIYLHPLIMDVIRNAEWDQTSQNGVLRLMRTLFNEITAESHKEEIFVGPGGAPISDDPENPVTDQRKLFRLVHTAMSVVISLSKDETISEKADFRRLKYAAVINLPRHEDNVILKFGQELLDDPSFLAPAEIMEIFEIMEKAYLERRDDDAAAYLVRKSERFAVDDHTRAEYFCLLGNLYDYRFQPETVQKNFECLEKMIFYARRTPHLPKKHLLAECLLGKINLLSRTRSEDRDEMLALFDEVEAISVSECLPYSEIPYGFNMAKAFYFSEIEEDRDKTDEYLCRARVIAEKLYTSGLDYIDRMIIPAAIMYIDMGAYEASAEELMAGIAICERNSDIAAYYRKKHELHQCLLDVFLESGDYDRAEEMIRILDEECREKGLQDTVQPEVRQFYNDRPAAGNTAS